jgi:hypothetical protein
MGKKRDQGLFYAAAFAAALMAMPATAQVVDYGKYPNFKGQWVRGPGSPNNWIPLAGQPPLTPEYKKIWDGITEDLKAGGPGNWPSTFCIPAGMPAMMSLYDPAEIIVTPEITYVLVSHNDDSYRRIYTDGRDWPKEPEPTFAGYSIGKWVDEDGDGKFDVLEIETRYLKLPRGYDITGIPFHEDGNAVIKERIYLDKANPNVLHDDITVFDDALIRPRVSNKRYVRELRPIVWVEAICPEGNPYVQLEGEIYMRAADGKLMPSKKNQTPPDLSYFKPTQ